MAMLTIIPTSATRPFAWLTAILLARLRRSIECALRAKRLTLEESRQLLKIYETGLSSYTYLEAD